MSKLAHRNDPATSHDAVPADTERLRSALMELLREAPRAAFQLEVAYDDLAFMNGWPLDIDPYSIHRRLSELHMAKQIRPVVADEEEVRLKNPKSKAFQTVWEVVEP